MTLLALDLNATRIRAALRAAGEASLVALEGDEADLPLAVSLEGRYPELGRAGTGLCRRSPHLACTNFLPYLGSRQEWAGPRQRLDAARAVALAFEQVASRLQPPSTRRCRRPRLPVRRAGRPAEQDRNPGQTAAARHGGRGPGGGVGGPRAAAVDRPGAGGRH